MTDKPSEEEIKWVMSGKLHTSECGWTSGSHWYCECEKDAIKVLVAALRSAQADIAALKERLKNG